MLGHVDELVNVVVPGPAKTEHHIPVTVGVSAIPVGRAFGALPQLVQNAGPHRRFRAGDRHRVRDKAFALDLRHEPVERILQTEPSAA